MAITLDKINFDNLPFEFSKTDFNENKKIDLAMNVDTSAEYTTNADEYFRQAMIGENSTRSKFRQVLGVKDRIKLGTAIFDSLIKDGACDFDPSDSTVSQKVFEVCPLMVGTSVCVQDLEVAFMSDQIARGSRDFSDQFAFMNFFYETLGMELQEEMEYLTWRGDSTGTLTGATAYLNTCDGLETKLAADVNVLSATSATSVTSSNVIAKLIAARDAMPKAVKNRQDFVYIVSTNVMEAYMDAISENKASGQYYVEGVTPNFQGIEMFHAMGASDDVIVAGNWRNFLSIQDLITDESGFEIVDFYKTKLDRKIGVRTDFKFSPDYIVSEEVYFHKP